MYYLCRVIKMQFRGVTSIYSLLTLLAAWKFQKELPQNLQSQMICTENKIFILQQSGENNIRI